jgi:hypothetical protein
MTGKLPLRRDILHRVGQAGGGKHCQLLGVCSQWHQQDEQEQNETHDGPSYGGNGRKPASTVSLCSGVSTRP